MSEGVSAVATILKLAINSLAAERPLERFGNASIAQPWRMGTGRGS